MWNRWRTSPECLVGHWQYSAVSLGGARVSPHLLHVATAPDVPAAHALRVVWGYMCGQGWPCQPVAMHTTSAVVHGGCSDIVQRWHDTTMSARVLLDVKQH